MSSKKAHRREQRRRERQSNRRRGRLSPVTLFILGISAAVLITVAARLVFGDQSGRGAPPWPGAVWSQSHGHWH